jgi:hypothetical protein
VKPLTSDAIRALEREEAGRAVKDGERLLVEIGVADVDPRAIDGGGKK